MKLTREDYRKVKRMDREQMDAYLMRIFKRGYDAGKKAISDRIKMAEANAMLEQAEALEE